MYITLYTCKYHILRTASPACSKLAEPEKRFGLRFVRAWRGEAVWVREAYASLMLTQMSLREADARLFLASGLPSLLTARRQPRYLSPYALGT